MNNISFNQRIGELETENHRKRFHKVLSKMEKNKKSYKFFNLQLLVPRPGIEPGWIAPLVFETSASTDSAIWAIASRLNCECKGTNNF